MEPIEKNMSFPRKRESSIVNNFIRAFNWRFSDQQILVLNKLVAYENKGKYLFADFSHCFLTQLIKSSTMMVYKQGIINRVKRVAHPKPKKMVLAMGAQISDFPPRPIIMGNTPNMVVIEVSIIGLKRRRPD